MLQGLLWEVFLQKELMSKYQLSMKTFKYMERYMYIWRQYSSIESLKLNYVLTELP